MSSTLRPHTPPISISDRTTEVTHTGSWKYLHPEYHDRVAPCVEGCPVGVDIEGYLTLLREGRLEDATDLLLRENPIPAITGRVCDHPCEARCNRAGLDGAVSIHAIERMLGDHILAAALPVKSEQHHTERTAVIGSGPAGFACAYHLARLGYAVDVYEKDAKPGGMLRQGIPEYRLPRTVLNREIERLEASGVVFHCNTTVGAAPSWREITESHDAVFVGIGAQEGRTLGVPGENLRGVRQGLDFLRVVNSGKRPKLTDNARVVVIGGGNTAMDCARTALRLGGKGAKVTVLYRRTRDEMPAIKDEIADAEREGVQFTFLVSPESFEKKNGKLAVVCTPMKLGEPDASGRRRPVASGEKPIRVPADMVLLAIGADVAIDGFPLRLGDDGALHVDAWGTSTETAIFGGGDVTGAERTVARALGAGKRAAIGIDRYLGRKRGESNGRSPETLRVGQKGTPSMTRWRGDDPVKRVSPVNTVVEKDELNFVHFALAKRHKDRHLGPPKRGKAATDRFAEVNLGLAAEAALAEAQRCLQCGVCNECELCLIYCSDVAIKRAHGEQRFDIDLDYCKGCGVCAAECPRGALTMIREGEA